MTDLFQLEGAMRPAMPETLELIRSFNNEGRCTFFISSNYMHAETAKLGYLLSRQLKPRVGDCRTFFVNSGLEALSGAIKLARQTSVRHQKSDGGWVLFVDERRRFQPFLDPTSKGEQHGLTPHVRFTQSVTEGLEIVGKQRWSALVLVRYTTEQSAQTLQLVQEARAGGAMIVCVDAELPIRGGRLFERAFDPDVVVYGENLCEHQLPFGCFTMTERAHAIWDNDVDCFAQTSTFGGNRICPAAALVSLRRHHYVDQDAEAVLRELDTNPERMIEYWGRHVNPGMARLASIFGMDLDVRQAFGGRFKLSDGREILDCSGGFGSNLRGHNPPDVDAVLREHDPEHDYFTDLEKLLCSLTKFRHAFPAVSGATAVDVAASIAMLANPSRRKVVTFNGNFSGKTLFALNFSKHGPQLTESDTDAFQPYYAELEYVDPFAPDAVARLSSVLQQGDVALVWFEMFRGGMCEELPLPIIELVDRLKSSCGYLIGVDEVLSGGWRSGADYLAHAPKIKNSDVVSLGKTLSDMTLPMAAVLVTEQVFERAKAENPGHIARLSGWYRNGLGAHIALNAIGSASQDARRAESLKNQRLIESGLRELAAASPLFGGVRGRGTLLVLLMNPRYFPFHHRSKLGNLLEMALAHLIFQRCGVFVFLLRFLHRVDSDERDVQEILRRLTHGLSGVTPFMLYRYALSRIFSQKLPRLARLFAGKLDHPVGERAETQERLQESALHRAR
jgi:acetylornithine/succinyldiaminopimelate/putrescine aminotransferase